MNELQQQLRRLDPCRDFIEWITDYDDILTAWNACPRGDWLLWLAEKLGVKRELLVLAACGCARLVLPFTTDERPRLAIQMAEQWAGGIPRPSIEQVRQAADAVTIQSRASRVASRAARAAVYAAEVVPFPATFAVGAVEMTASAACYIGTPKAITFRTCADIVRKWIDNGTVMMLWQSYVHRCEIQKATQ